MTRSPEGTVGRLKRFMIRDFLNFLKLLVHQKDLIVSLAKREVATQYTGSLLGFAWTFLHPMMLTFVFWAIFSIGFRVQPEKDVPFVVWLIAGMSAWFVFADIVNGSTGVILSNVHLIKKTLFHAHILPVVKVASCLFTHSVFLLVLVGLIVLQKMPFSLYYFQFLYYLFGLCVLGLGLGWTVSALNVFIRDVGQITRVLLQMGFWSTPILWDLGMMPPGIQTLLKLNPLFYIVQGYRESFIYFRPFWIHPRQTLYFWAFSIGIFVIGALIFKKLKPQFADVL